VAICKDGEIVVFDKDYVDFRYLKRVTDCGAADYAEQSATRQSRREQAKA